MDINLIILIIILCSIVYMVYTQFTHPGMVYVKSAIDGEFYLVRDTHDKDHAANVLAKIKQNMINLSDFLYQHANDKDNAKYKQYIERLHKRVSSIIIMESEQDSIYTSYSINKGEQIVFCLRSRKLSNQLHNINLMMYVVLHEISHVACPIYDNHGPLFRDIFGFITRSVGRRFLR